MTAAITQFAFSVAIVVVAGTILTRCADTIAVLTRLGRVLVGSIFLAAATSLPELAGGPWKTRVPRLSCAPTHKDNQALLQEVIP